MIRNFASLWEQVADSFGDRDAVIQGERVVSWREFEERAARLAAALSALGVEAGTRVGIDLWNCPENLETVFAAFKLRAVPFNVNYRYQAGELVYLWNDARPPVVVFDAALGERVRASTGELDFAVELVEVHGEGHFGERFESLLGAHSPAPRVERSSEDELIIYTGGTTGYPKGVVWPHEMTVQLPLFEGRAVESTEEFLAAIAAADRRVQLVTAPLMHGTGILYSMGCLTSGGCVVFCTSRSLDPEEILRVVERRRVTAFSVVGDAIARPILEFLDDAAACGRAFDLSSVQTISNTGAVWSASVKRGFFAHGSFVIMDSINATEAAGFAVTEARGADEVEDQIAFRLGPNARVITADGRDVVPGSGEVGFLATTGRLPKGYLNDPARSASAWPTIGGIRYSVPGDMARIEADGTVTLLGRSSEVVNTGGEKVFVEEVEAAIATHRAVADALVVGLPDDRWGSRVTAVVQLKAGATAEAREIIDHVGSQIADYKRPREVVFVEEIPRTVTGKADRVGARRLAEAAS